MGLALNKDQVQPFRPYKLLSASVDSLKIKINLAKKKMPIKILANTLYSL